MQLEESAETHMIHAYVHLQEGAIMEGDNRINLAINKALEMCASCSISLFPHTVVLEWPFWGFLPFSKNLPSWQRLWVWCGGIHCIAGLQATRKGGMTTER